VYAGLGLLLLIVPGWALERFGQPPYPDLAFVRIAGASSIGLALFATMVERRDDAWWWAWGFAIVTALWATICALHATLDAPAGGEALWWVLAVVNAGLTAWLVVGLTRASQEHPIA
jgi:hypothetical protein